MSAEKRQRLEEPHQPSSSSSSSSMSTPMLLRVKKLTEHAIIPYRASKKAAGYDLSSAYDCAVPAHGKALVKTDLSIAVPEGCYGRIGM
jgi:dUTP pyrophosphatase